MKEKMKDFSEIVAKINFIKCGNITCIHNAGNKCILKKCDMYEKGLDQEH